MGDRVSQFHQELVFWIHWIKVLLIYICHFRVLFTLQSFFLIWWHHLRASFGFAHKFDNHISSGSKWALQIVFSNSFEFQYLNIHRRSFALINVIFNMVSWTVHVRYSSSIRPRWTCVEICFYWSLIQRQFFCVIFSPLIKRYSFQFCQNKVIFCWLTASGIVALNHDFGLYLHIIAVV